MSHGDIRILTIDDDDDHQPAQMKIAPSISINNMDGPLLIVPDDDDYGEGSDEEESICLLSLDDAKESIQMGNTISSDMLQEIDKMGELLPSSSAPATITSSSSPQPVGPWKKPVNQKPVKTKHSQVKRHIPCSIDSILSTITFDDRSDILTVSRMGSIYYCLEDLYLKLFSSLCTLEELTDLLIRSKTVLLKQVTLSEKIAIEERIPKLKSSCLMRYRLISLNFSDFLIKLKHLLLYHSAESRLERILKKMRDDNQSSTNVPRKENSSAKRVVSDGDGNSGTRKRVKIVKKTKTTHETMPMNTSTPSQHPATMNQSIRQDIHALSSTDDSGSTVFVIDQGTREAPLRTQSQIQILLETPIDISQEDSNTSVDQHTSHLPNGTRSAVSSTDESRRSSASLTSSVDTLHMKVFSVTHESLPVTSPLPPSMPSDPMGFSTMQINETPSCSSDDSRSMPKIIQVEENVTMCEEPRVDTNHLSWSVQLENLLNKSLDPSNSSTNGTAPAIRLPPVSLSSSSQTDIQASTSNLSLMHQTCLHYDGSRLTSNNIHTSYAKLHPTLPPQVPPVSTDRRSSFGNSNIAPSVLPPMLRNTIPTKSTSRVEAPPPPPAPSCELTCLPSSLLSKRHPPSNTVVYQSHCLLPQDDVIPVAASLPRPNPRLIAAKPPLRLLPSPVSFVAPVVHENYDVHHASSSIPTRTLPMVLSPPEIPAELTLPNIPTRSLHVQQAITEHQFFNMDQIPKLLVRHTKVYSHRSVNITGHLIPTWFEQPYYRCIHCFSCDHVFTPQHFMTHFDHEPLPNEQLLHMSSINLLSSEMLSEHKVELWNRFCTNLSKYASHNSQSKEKPARKTYSKKSADNRIFRDRRLISSISQDKGGLPPYDPLSSVFAFDEFD